MKKIIAILLSLVCVFGLASCGEDAPQDAALNAITAAISAADPTGAVLETKITSKTFGISLEGEYTISFGEDGTATVSYTYDQLNLIGAGTSGTNITAPVEGVATIAKDGTVTVVEGEGSVGAQITAVAGVKLNLDATKMTYSISSGVLSATVKAQDTRSVFGIDIEADVGLVVSTANGKVSTITLTYVTDEVEAEIVCVYNY